MVPISSVTLQTIGSKLCKLELSMKWQSHLGQSREFLILWRNFKRSLINLYECLDPFYYSILSYRIIIFMFAFEFRFWDMRNISIEKRLWRTAVLIYKKCSNLPPNFKIGLLYSIDRQSTISIVFNNMSITKRTNSAKVVRHNMQLFCNKKK